jgi:uncharacterized membrane protein
MLSLVLAGAFFLGLHLIVSGSPLRGTIVARTGERAFQGLFSLLSLIGLVWLSTAYARAAHVELWGPVDALRPAVMALVLVAFLLAVLGLTTPSPTATGGESRLDAPDPAQGVLRITRHPFLWGVTIWAFAHLVVNGDAASLVLFGTLLVLALVGPLSIDAKRRRTFGERWDRFAAATSVVPFAAILQGRNALRLGELGWWRLALGVVLYLVFLGLHTRLFGVSPFPV